MKILQFGKFYPPDLGGIETVMLELTEGLNQYGVHSDVLCSNTKKETLIENINGYLVTRSYSFGKKFSTSISPLLVWHLMKMYKNYDVIHVHLPDPLAILAILIVNPKCKIVLHWHGDVDFNKFKVLKHFYKPLQSWIITKADHIIAPTKIHIINSDSFELMKDKYSIIPYPFDVEKLLSIQIDYHLLNQYKQKNKFIIFALGRLAYYKGFSYLVEAAKDLTDDYLILIGGTGEEENSLQRIIKLHNLESKVKLVGKIEDKLIATYYSMCDVFCFPSIYRGEMFGMVQLEAMTFRKPIIGTKIENSGVCEVNIHNDTGLCIEPKSSFMISEAIIKLKNDKELYNKFSDNGFNRVMKKFDKHSVIPQYISFYEKLVNGLK